MVRRARRRCRFHLFTVPAVLPVEAGCAPLPSPVSCAASRSMFHGCRSNCRLRGPRWYALFAPRETRCRSSRAPRSGNACRSPTSTTSCSARSGAGVPLTPRRSPRLSLSNRRWDACVRKSGASANSTTRARHASRTQRARCIATSSYDGPMRHGRRGGAVRSCSCPAEQRRVRGIAEIIDRTWCGVAASLVTLSNRRFLPLLVELDHPVRYARCSTAFPRTSRDADRQCLLDPCHRHGQSWQSGHRQLV